MQSNTFQKANNMTKNTKIIIGVGAIALAYYLFKDKFALYPKPEHGKSSGGVPIPRGQETPTSEPSVFNCQNGKPFSLKDNYINGIIPNLKGGTTNHQAIPNILFKKGDLVCGDVITKFIFNKNMRGILAKPTVKGAYYETSMEFIPIEYLTPLSQS